MIDQSFGWSGIFLLLTFAALIVFFLTLYRLPETHLNRTTTTSFLRVATDILKDSRVLGFAVIVGAANGISFTYYAEGSFYLINLLGLSPSIFGLTFIAIACSAGLGAWYAHWLHNHLTSQEIMLRGIIMQLIGSSFFVLSTLFVAAYNLPSFVSIVITLGSMSIISVGNALAVPTALSLALEDYQHVIGSASSIFGFFYYALISIFTLFMGLIHNGTLYPMPFYFLGITLLIAFVYYKFIRKSEISQSAEAVYEGAD